jgi:hypothetical protein
MEIQQAVVHHKRAWTIQFLHRTKEQLCQMNVEKVVQFAKDEGMELNY